MVEHEALLQRWRERPHHVGRGFVSDGPIDFERWSRARRRVLFLLKEAYNDPGDTSGSDLCEYLRARVEDHRLGLTFWTVAYWAYLVKRMAEGGSPPFPATKSEYDSAREGLLEVAVVNVKKSGGVPVSDETDLRSYVERDGDLLKHQVEILRPQIVVCGNTWSIVKVLWPEAEARYDLVREIGAECLAVDLVHPGLRVLQRLPYYALSAVLGHVRLPGEAL